MGVVSSKAVTLNARVDDSESLASKLVVDTGHSRSATFRRVGDLRRTLGDRSILHRGSPFPRGGTVKEVVALVVVGRPGVGRPEV